MPDSQDSPLGKVLPGPGGFRNRAPSQYVPPSQGADEALEPSLWQRPSVGDDVVRPDLRSKSAASQLPPLPQRRPGASRKLLLSFLLCVVLPTALVAAYYYIVAADQYVAEFKFAVTESSPVLPGLPPASTTTSPTAGSGGAGMGMALMGGAAAMLGGSNASMQNYIVTDYLVSRQAVEELQKRLDIRAMYDRSELKYDLPARFDRDLPMERFVRYWKRMVTAAYDPATGIAVVTVRAFSPEDAQRIADTMVSLSEDLVNGIAKRPQLDAVRYAESEVNRAEERLKQARDALTAYRLREGVVDPSGAQSTNLALVQALRGQLIQQQTDLAALLSQQQNPNAAPVQALRSRIAATKDQLENVEREVSRDRDGNRILTELVDRYELIDLERQYAQGMLVAAQQALDQARANAAAQHLYLTPFVRPSLPEYPVYPKKIQGVLLAALGFLGLWLVGTMIVRSVAEHA